MTWLEGLALSATQGLDGRVREALYARGVTDEQIVAFRIGYLDRRLPDLAYSQAFLNWSSHSNAAPGSKLDDVFVLPLTNTLGQVKGFQFRHVERARGGYMDFIAEKGEAVLFGLDQAMPHIWKSRSVWLVEGAFDLFPVQRCYPPTVATLTNRVVTPLVRILRRLVDQIWVGYDMDKPGRDACARFAKHHGHEFGVGIVKYPQVTTLDGSVIKDPADLWEVWGDTQFASFVRATLARSRTEPFDAETLW